MTPPSEADEGTPRQHDREEQDAGDGQDAREE